MTDLRDAPTEELKKEAAVRDARKGGAVNGNTGWKVANGLFAVILGLLGFWMKGIDAKTDQHQDKIVARQAAVDAIPELVKKQSDIITEQALQRVELEHIRERDLPQMELRILNAIEAAAK